MNDSAEPESHRLTRTVAVPGWMVHLAIYALGILGAGAVATLVSVVNWAFILQGDVGDVKADLAAAKVKETDLVHSVASLQREIREDNGEQSRALGQLQRDVDVIKARMP